MRAAVAVLWFLTAFLAGATLYVAIRPGLPVHPMHLEEGLFGRCRQAGGCGEPDAPSPGPPLPADIDRA